MEAQRKNSRKRSAIYQALYNTKEHPSAEMLYMRLKPEYPELSLGTVYRNLCVLEQDGLARRVGCVDGQERYDAKVESHAHFVCRACRAVSDIERPEVERMTGSLKKLADTVCGGEAESFDLNFYGLCAACRAERDFTAQQRDKIK